MQNYVSLRRLRRLALLPALALVSSCENSVSITADVLAGNYAATVFVMIPSGQPAVDVLAKGGSLVIIIAADSSMTGQLIVPAGVPGLQAGTADMKGRVFRNPDGTFRFDQVESTFMESLIWQLLSDSMVTTSLLVNTQFQIALRK
jgi:hypothetical protein